MSKPAYFLVWVNGTQHRHNTRSAARLFAAMHKALGARVFVQPVGF
jgi:hypothetical protein